ncbi:hypothetical protein DBY65_026525 [Pseudomonas sp. RIT412]|nr:hypothetical protein DBP26_022640 [Pseudomonas sp. RIT 409]RAU45244.1 hypothetical protein DBY65_026525 [Pseudomonas sp. RIT 412]
MPAPDIKSAFHDNDNFGLIPISALSSPLIVDFQVWEAAEPGYTYQLLWNNSRVGPEIEISDTDKPGDPLTLEVPLELLTEGLHSVGYRTYSPFADSENFSERFPVVIDRTAPGKPDLAIIHFPAEVQNGLTAAELTALGGTLKAEIVGYTGMAKHDSIKTYWGDIEGPTAEVDESDMGINKVIIEFSRDFLESIEPGVHPVKYRVTDRAGNVSDDSISVDILLLLEEIPVNYPAPILDPALGTLIDHAEAKPGVQVDIPHYPGASAFDQITLFWGDDLQMLPVLIPPGNENQDIVLSLRVPYETLAVKPVGKISIFYRVTRQNQLNGSSLSAQVEVFLTLPIPESAEPLIVQGTSLESPNVDDNFIDEDDYELNARAILKWSPAFRVNDDIHLLWGDQQRLQWHQITEADVAIAKDLIIPVANSIMKAQGTGAEIPVRYSVTRSGNPNPSTSVVQKITVRSKEDLPGGTEGIDGPVFQLNPAGYISQSVAPDGTVGNIAAYINIAENQKLFFTFRGFDRENNLIDAATFTASRELDDQDVVNGYGFKVPYRILRIICRGFCEAYFRVEPAPGSNQSSVTSRITRVPVEMRESSEPFCTL